jgi:uncharacterized protein YukE
MTVSEINANRIKEYNKRVKNYKDTAFKLKAEIQFHLNELNKLCEELSEELGIKVTPENIEKIRKERLEKIQETLKVGEEILDNITKEEKRIENNF